MRKYISFILLIIILFISNGYYLYFKYLQHNIQQEIKKDLNKENDFSIIVMSLNNEKEIEWTIKNKEFRYKGMMYDVVKTKIKNNKKYYYCIKDTKERNLIANFTKHNRKKNKVLLKLKKILNNKYFPEYYTINNKVNRANIYFAKYQSLYKSIFKEPISPPPKFNFDIS